MVVLLAAVEGHRVVAAGRGIGADRRRIEETGTGLLAERGSPAAGRRGGVAEGRGICAFALLSAPRASHCCRGRNDEAPSAVPLAPAALLLVPSDMGFAPVAAPGAYGDPGAVVAGRRGAEADRDIGAVGNAGIGAGAAGQVRAGRARRLGSPAGRDIGAAGAAGIGAVASGQVPSCADCWRHWPKPLIASIGKPTTMASVLLLWPGSSCSLLQALASCHWQC